MKIKVLLCCCLLVFGIATARANTPPISSALPAPVPFATPVASSFSTAVPANRQSAVTLLGSDADNTSLTYATVAGPTHGTLSNLNTSTGVVIYTPTASYTGADSFTYTVTSGGDTSLAGTVTLTVTNAKTRIIDTLVNPSGGPRRGMVTFILTQPVTSPGGITPAGATVSATLNGAGQFDISVYPSKSLSPAAYYQVWYNDSSGLNRELIGVYDIPLSTSTTVVLSPYKVVDTNLTARYTFASEAAVSALTAAAASATVSAQLLGTSPVNNKVQKYDSVAGKLTNSTITDDGTDVSLTHNLAVGNNVTAAGNVTAGGDVHAVAFTGNGSALTGLLKPSNNLSDLSNASAARNNLGLGAIATYDPNNLPALNAVSFTGNGAGLTGIGAGTGGVINTGSTTVGADSDTNGVGKISLQTAGVERIGIEADGSIKLAGQFLFSGVGNGSTSNNTAFSAVIGSAYKRISLPPGDYLTTLASTLLAEKAWSGPGRFLDSGTYAPGFFRYWLTTPTAHTGIDYFSGDQSLTEPEQWVLGPDVRSASSASDPLTQEYFESTTTPRWVLYTNYGGHSGITALLTAAASGAVTTVTVNSVADLAVGQKIAFTNVSSGALENTRTITAINSGTKVVTFTPALPGPTSYPIGGVVSTGNRTMNQYQLINSNQAGFGDLYGITVRSTMSTVAGAGQTHPFFTATGGMIGGDAHIAGTRLYWTTIEHNVYDDGNDVQVAGYIQTFNRTNATKAWEWGGIFFNGAGTQAVNYGMSLANNFTVGLDTVLANSTTKAVNMKVGQCVVFNSTADSSRLYTGWGGLIGNSQMCQETGGDWKIVHNGVEMLRSASATSQVTLPVGLIVGGGTGAPSFFLNGGAGTAEGPSIQFRTANATIPAAIGTEAVITGAGTSQALVLNTYSGLDLKLNPASGIVKPLADNATALGNASFRFTNGYFSTALFSPKVCFTTTVCDWVGTGTPEGAITAGIGSTFRRTNGGAATSFYVKESGTGNTGWVAK
jgi:hypothetical protein